MNAATGGDAFSALPPDADLYLLPCGLINGPAAQQAVQAGHARWLGGGPAAFTGAGAYIRYKGAIEHVPFQPIAKIEEALDKTGRNDFLGNFTGAPAALSALPDAGGLPLIMGILNATTDSFSGDGAAHRPDMIIGTGLEMIEQGAAILDIGGESTRPGAEPVDAATEWQRIEPAIEELSGQGVLVSADTRHAATMEKALAAGAGMINDISALTHDPASMAVLAASDVPVVLMHSPPDPRTMHRNMRYANVSVEVFDHLQKRIEACREAGIGRERLIVDPGIGFGKSPKQNYQLIRDAALFHGLGCPVLYGISRKTFLPKVEGEPVHRRRLTSSLAAALRAVAQGVQILRVHDVAHTVAACAAYRQTGGEGL